MTDPGIFDPQELGRWQKLAAARRQRESLAFLAQLVDAQRGSDELKRWISANSRSSDHDTHPTLRRMVVATSQLDDLERTLKAQERLPAVVADLAAE